MNGNVLEHVTSDQRSIRSTIVRKIREEMEELLLNSIAIRAQIQSQKDRMISIQIQGKPIYIIVIQIYAPSTDAEEA